MITRFGKRFITNYLAGNIDFTNKDMAFGIGSTAATELDTRLEFEFYRMPVTLGSIDIQSNGLGGFNYFVVYKATIPQDVVGQISEVAIVAGNRSSRNLYDSKYISDFEDNLIWFDSTNFNPSLVYTPTPKIGNSMISIAGTTTGKEYTANINNFDISGYSVNDSVTLAYYKTDNNLSSIKLRFYSSSNSYYETTVVTSPAAGTGFRIASVNLSSLFSNQTGTPDASAISKIGIITTSTTGTSTVYYDGLRINDEDTFDPTFGIISRSVLGTTLVKSSGRQVDIEYRMQLNF